MSVLNQGPLLFVVDDEEDARDMLCLHLQRAGFRTSVFDHGRALIEALLDGKRPDLIILDLMMPVMNGWRTHAWLATSAFAGVPVVIWTAAGKIEPLPGVEMLMKTTPADELTARVQARCSESVAAR